MKAKDFFALIDAVKEDEIREDSVMYRNAFEAILSLKDSEQLDVFRWFFAYSLYGIEPKFDENLIKNRQNKSSIEFIFSLIKKQRIGWEKSKTQSHRHRDPMGGSGGGTPPNTLSHAGDKQVTNVTSISNDIQVPNGTSPIGQVVSQQGTPPIIPPQNGRVGYDAYGKDDFKNVFLKPAELRQLQMNFGEEETQEAIEDLSLKLEDGTQKPSLNHYATLTYWLTQRRKKKLREKEKDDHYKGDDTIGKNFVRRGLD